MGKARVVYRNSHGYITLRSIPAISEKAKKIKKKQKRKRYTIADKMLFL